MNALESAVLISLLVLPFYWAVMHQVDALDDPDYLRSHGIVIVKETAVQPHPERVGEYMGSTIWGSLTFKGMHYRFDRVTSPLKKERIGTGELYLEPGLVYVTG